jgi:NhaP-type Na+/H+ or K+/H+ antiporter
MVSTSAVYSIFFVFFALAVGSGVLFICSRFDHIVPYSVVIFIVGIIVSITADLMTAEDAGDALTISAEQWIRIDPDVLLCSFLPALLFGEAMHLNFYQIKKAIVPAALLAFPGAAFGAYIQALFCFSPGFPVMWSWRMCFAVGAVLSATDPVSVVATLKGLSSSSASTMKLTYLIGEEQVYNSHLLYSVSGEILSGSFPHIEQS